MVEFFGIVCAVIWALMFIGTAIYLSMHIDWTFGAIRKEFVRKDENE